MKTIKYFVMDVDGTLTDGKIYMGKSGEAIKAFNIKDGCGILWLLPKYNITPVIITARKSEILENRCKEIGISQLYQGVSNKLEMLKKIVGTDLSVIAYVGDDLPDIPCIEEVKNSGGVVLCPSDAIPEIKALADYVSESKAGDGAVRECINYLINGRKADCEIKVREVMGRILSGDYSDGMIGCNPYFVQEYETKREEECIIETHRRHIDIQYILEGKEEFKIYMPSGLVSKGLYDEERDVEYWSYGRESSHSILVPGSMIVVYNGQAHRGGIKHNTVQRVKKLVCKIEC